MVLVCEFARLPDELADGDEAGCGHAPEEHHEHAAHVVQAELVGRVGPLLGVLLLRPGTVSEAGREGGREGEDWEAHALSLSLNASPVARDKHRNTTSLLAVPPP